MPLYALGEFEPKLPASDRYWIAPGAHVMGKVDLAEDVGIWFGAVLRGDNEWITIGARTNIQENTVIHTDWGSPTTIGEDCTIGHSLIGMGATILNGAKIGNNCLVGANALVTEGKEFPDNSLIVGSPAKAIRTLDEASAAKLKASALNYTENWKRFASELKEI